MKYEILSELDEETAQSIVDCVRALQEETGMTVVIVEHNLDVARELSDQLLRVEAGGIQEHAESADAIHTDAQQIHD